VFGALGAVTGRPGLKAWPSLRVRCSGGLAETIFYFTKKNTKLMKIFELGNQEPRKGSESSCVRWKSPRALSLIATVAILTSWSEILSCVPAFLSKNFGRVHSWHLRLAKQKPRFLIRNSFRIIGNSMKAMQTSQVLDQ